MNRFVDFCLDFPIGDIGIEAQIQIISSIASILLLKLGKHFLMFQYGEGSKFEKELNDIYKDLCDIVLTVKYNMIAKSS